MPGKPGHHGHFGSLWPLLPDMKVINNRITFNPMED